MQDDSERRARQVQKRLRERQKATEQMIDNAIRLNSKTPEGRKFLWWLLQIGKVNTQPFTTNAITTAFNCGELNVGNTILARITDVDPASYVQMQQESLNEYRELTNPNSAEPDSDSPGSTAGSYDAPSGGPDTLDD